MHNQDTVTGPSFSLKNRLGRVLWSVFYVLFFRFTPNPLHSWRSFVLRMFGAKVGKGVHVYPSVKIWAPWNMEFGDHCGIGNGAILYSQGKIHIGQRAVISQGSHLCAGTHDFTKTGFPLITKPIYIGDQAWLAAETFMHPGVTVGEGAVIGARSVVTKDMPAWMVCSGFPCKPIKPRVMEENSRIKAKIL
ncbi:WcaF family extracellular polysaccharide biosynthesis acetyltransferase [Cognataquiflexum rubidum]|uniref:WcaF family extracellular polysaccharide biosynthesis acetyltransferase n=1 Tax=Cognataquiflexum rubidum TaxID=2922273 RepID=UPI001F14644F|nr:WcaF family extracellular polysaccharide biosynthesis acetyltransferase [Cognataquiflexum rubidum]MCH6234041.1 WcaF family extracellular polysaccharide biosynthesis acetyltransferase [Cognataquiflexum rubidum]